MIPSESDLQKAFAYAQVDGASIEVSPQLGRDQKTARYHQILEVIRTPEGLFGIQDWLYEHEPLLQLVDDREIAEYFQGRWKIPIQSREDLTLFSDAVSEKVCMLGEDKDLEARIKERGQRLQLRELPRSLSSIRDLNDNYDRLKPFFSLVMHHVYNRVTREDFRMKENGAIATEPYEGEIKINRIEKKTVNIQIKLNEENLFEFYLNPSNYRTRVVVPAKKRKLWWDRKEKVETTKEVAALEVLPLFVFGISFANNRKSSGHYPYDSMAPRYCKTGRGKWDVTRMDLDGYLDNIKYNWTLDPDKHSDSFVKYLQILFRLPRLIDNYINRVSGPIKAVADQSLEIIAAEETLPAIVEA